MDYVINNEKLMAEWDWDKNNKLGFDPNKIKCGSDKKVWWKCEMEHNWYARISNRAILNRGCPVCYEQRRKYNRVKPEDGKSLQDVYPNIAKEWCISKNNGLLPTQVKPYSNKKVWWECQYNHEWEATINKRTADESKCPVCSNRQIVAGFNDFATLHPELLKEWDYDKNDILPTQISATSNAKIWWKCNENHSWKTQIYVRTKMGCGCPYCAPYNCKVQEGFNDLATTHPILAKEWDYDKNVGLSPMQFSYGSDQKIWWLCSRGHSYQARIVGRSIGSNCPICARETQTSFPEQAIYYYLQQIASVENRYLINKNTEIDVYLPEYQIGIEFDGYYYHHKLEKKQKDNNKALTAESLGIYLIRVLECLDVADLSDSDTVIHYQYASNHYRNLNDTIQKIIDRINKIASTNFSIDIDIERDTMKIYEQYIVNEKKNSLATKNPELAKEWHPTKNGRIKPDMVTYSSAKKIWWLCNKGHDFLATIANRRRGNGCPYCSDKRVLAGYNDIVTTHPYLLSEWNYRKNNEVTPEMLSFGSNTKVWWICSDGHEWLTDVAHRVSGRGCPECAKLKRIASRRIPIICVELQQVFMSLVYANQQTGIDKQYISDNLCGRRSRGGKHPITGEPLHWHYLYDQTRKDGTIIPGAITLGLITEEEALAQLATQQND